MNVVLNKNRTHLKMEMTRGEWEMVEFILRMWLQDNRTNPMAIIVLSLYNPRKLFINQPAVWSLQLAHASLLYMILKDLNFRDMAYEINHDRMMLGMGKFKYLLSKNG